MFDYTTQEYSDIHPINKIKEYLNFYFMLFIFRLFHYVKVPDIQSIVAEKEYKYQLQLHILK